MIRISIFPLLLFIISCSARFESRNRDLKNDSLYSPHTICEIIPESKDFKVIRLDKMEKPNESHKKDTIYAEKAYQVVHYAYDTLDLDFSIYYALDYKSILINIGQNWLTTNESDYLRLYKKNYFDGLYNFGYRNYLLSNKTDSFLICAVNPSHNKIAYLNTIIFIVNLGSGSKPTLFSIGTFGLCDNSIGDFNGDGNLDIILSRLDSINPKPLDHNNPKGRFSASAYSIINDQLVELKKDDEQLAVEFEVTNEGISVLSGHWF